MKRLALAAIVLAALAPFVFAPSAAFATQQGVAVMKSWKAMDNCAHQAQVAHPDFTADANAKRDAAEAECLRNSNLPPREPLAPAPR